MKRVAVFSDIHGNLQALTSIIEDINKSNFDQVIYLGDIIGAGPNPKECLDILIDSNIKVIKGNHEIYQTNEEIAGDLLTPEELEHRNWIHDQLDEEELKYLHELPMEREELICGHLMTFSHFFLNDSKTYFESLKILGNEKIFEAVHSIETDYLFIGHSHDAFQINNTTLLTCLGSSGCRKNNTTFYTILEIYPDNVVMIKKELNYDRKTFEKEVKSIDYPNREKMAEIFFGITIKEEEKQ